MQNLTVLVNDEEKSVPVGETIASLIERLAIKPRGIAVACNSEVVPQENWKATQLKSHDSILIITATQGG